jgi:O-antigen biosynthesis protein
MKRPIRILAWPNSSGSGYWRIKDPFYYLNKTGEFECMISTDPITEEALAWSDIFITQSIVAKNQLALAYMYQQEYGKKWICEQDDYPKLTEDNPFKLNFDMADASDVIGRCLRVCDMITASTPYLAEQFEEFNENIMVLPNYMNMKRWDLQPKIKNNNGKIKILWGGSVTHVKDMEMISRIINRVAKEYPTTEFVCIGDIRLASFFKDTPNAEFTLGTTFEAWPSKLRGVRADIGLAPVQDTLFSRCKSWIKPLEYGINEIPCIVSDIEPYRELFRNNAGFPIRLAKTEDDWYTSLKELVEDKNTRVEEGKALYNEVKENFDLEKHIDMWAKAYKSLL